jgi:WD40 repeat protein
VATLKGLESSIGHNSFNVSFNSEGTRVAVGAKVSSVANAPSFPEVTVFDAQSGEEVLSLKGHVTRLNWVAFSPNGRCLASASLGRNYSARWNRPGVTPVPGGGIGIWDAQSGKLLRTLEGHTDGTGCVAFSPDGTRLASGGGDEASNSGEVKIWNAETGEQLLAMKHGSGLEGISAVTFSPDGQRLASASHDDRTVKIWDAQKGEEILILKGHSATVSGVAYSPDATRIATAGRDKTVKLWNAQTGEELLTLEAHGGWINGLAFSPDGHLLAAGGPDGTIKIYDATPLPEKP